MNYNFPVSALHHARVSETLQNKQYVECETLCILINICQIWMFRIDKNIIKSQSIWDVKVLRVSAKWGTDGYGEAILKHFSNYQRQVKVDC